MAKTTTGERASQGQTQRRTRNISALQEWLDALSPTWDAVVVTAAIGIAMVAVALLLDILFWHTLF